jgi:hypothetical protein
MTDLFEMDVLDASDEARRLLIRYGDRPLTVYLYDILREVGTWVLANEPRNFVYSSVGIHFRQFKSNPIEDLDKSRCEETVRSEINTWRGDYRTVAVLHAPL